jgi:hypothetical protein
MVEALVLVSMHGDLNGGGGHLLVYIKILRSSAARMTNSKNKIENNPDVSRLLRNPQCLPIRMPHSVLHFL